MKCVCQGKVAMLLLTDTQVYICTYMVRAHPCTHTYTHIDTHARTPTHGKLNLTELYS